MQMLGSLVDNTVERIDHIGQLSDGFVWISARLDAVEPVILQRK